MLPKFDQLVAHIQGKSLRSLMHAMLVGTQRAYQAKNGPLYAVTMPEKTCRIHRAVDAVEDA